MKDRWMTKVYLIISCRSTNMACCSTHLSTRTQSYHLLTKTDNVRGSPQLDSKFLGWDYDMHADTMKWIRTGQWERRAGRTAKSPKDSFHRFSNRACTPPIMHLWLGQEAFFLWRRASTLCLMLCLLELLSYYLDSHLTGNQKDATDSFHMNHRKKSQLTGSVPEGTLISHFKLTLFYATNLLFLVLRFTKIYKAPFP